MISQVTGVRMRNRLQRVPLRSPARVDSFCRQFCRSRVSYNEVVSLEERLPGAPRRFTNEIEYCEAIDFSGGPFGHVHIAAHCLGANEAASQARCSSDDGG